MTCSALDRLKRHMPPPTEPQDAEVNWELIESRVGLTYPASFKDFVRVYGGSVWFDNFSPFYTPAQSEAEIKDFLKFVRSKLSYLKGQCFDSSYKKVETPLYPEKGGLFPFMIDYSSWLYCWLTVEDDPEKWPIVIWTTGQLITLEGTGIADMFAEWFEGTPRMKDVWGDIGELPPERIRLD